MGARIIDSGRDYHAHRILPNWQMREMLRNDDLSDLKPGTILNIGVKLPDRHVDVRFRLGPRGGLTRLKSPKTMWVYDGAA